MLSVLVGTSPFFFPDLLQLVPVTRIDKFRDEQGLLQEMEEKERKNYFY